MGADHEQLRADPADRTDLAPAAPGARKGLVFAVLLAAALLAAWLWWTGRGPAVPPPAAAPAGAPDAAASSPASPAPGSATYPMPPLEEEQALGAEGVEQALADLLGRKAVEGFLHPDGFPRRFAATLDNLGREHAPPHVWPVAPTPGRFTVETGPDGPVIAADNAARYTPFVLLAGTVDAGQAVRLYRRMYPLLQAAYRELGFGERQLNDRVVEVIDVLLATPEPEQPPRVMLTEVRGPVAPERPWTQYRFVDPQLEQLTAGQKILVRVGPVNGRRLKGKLRELREQLLQAAQERPGR